jgi:lipoprotein-releasing system permease protein
MYKYLLCLRYLRTRYIALASIVSVMLGVATMIVVNAVMAGFVNETQIRIQGVISDVVVESHSLDGFPAPQWHMDQIRRVAGDEIAGMTATVQVPGMLIFNVHGKDGAESITRQVNVVGIDDATYASVSDFGKYMQHPANRERLSFDLREDGYDTRDHQTPDGEERKEFENAGWKYRRMKEAHNARLRREAHTPLDVPPESESPAAAGRIPNNLLADASAPESEVAGKDGSQSSLDAMADDGGAHNPFSNRWQLAEGEANVFNPARDQHTGIVLGIALPSYRHRDADGEVQTGFLLRPGDDVQLMLPSAGNNPKGVRGYFTVVDFYDSKMFEYDSTLVFVPMSKLQELRGMFDRATGATYVSAIRIKTKPGVDGVALREKLRAATVVDEDARMAEAPLFPPTVFSVSTWRDKQGPLLAAVEMEKATLNLLLFLIIAVAGFGILATFFMIVVEKTRDIGILKSLGATSQGVMGIFVSYGLSLGCVGAGFGLALGLLFVQYINEIRRFIEHLTGREVFDPTIYYFYKIPTIIDWFTVGCVVAGAMLIAVLASVLPALRAAMLHPVEALRS